VIKRSFIERSDSALFRCAHTLRRYYYSALRAAHIHYVHICSSLFAALIVPMCSLTTFALYLSLCSLCRCAPSLASLLVATLLSPLLRRCAYSLRSYLLAHYSLRSLFACLHVRSAHLLPSALCIRCAHDCLLVSLRSTLRCAHVATLHVHRSCLALNSLRSLSRCYVAALMQLD
jgi:hypothetical protein